MMQMKAAYIVAPLILKILLEKEYASKRHHDLCTSEHEFDKQELTLVHFPRQILRRIDIIAKSIVL